MSSIEVISIESINGRSLQALELYFPLMNSKETQDIYNRLKILYELGVKKNINNLSDLGNEKLIQVLSLSEDQRFDFDLLEKLKSLDMIPILNEFGLYSDNKDFLNNIPNIPKNNNLTSIHPILKMALEDALNDERVPEILFILCVLVEGKNLNEISSLEILEIVRYLKKIGLERNAKQITLEWMTNRFVEEITTSYIKTNNG